MLYLVITANSFRKSSLDELSRFTKFRIVSNQNNILVIESENKNLREEVYKSKPVFVYDIFPLIRSTAIEEGRYLDSIYSAVFPIVQKQKKTKLECFDVNSKRGYSAKDIEVEMGGRLEREGFRIDLAKPDFLVYMVLIDMKCYVGHANYSDLRRKFIDPARHYFYAKDKVSRAELKLKEAFDEFKIKRRGIAIDMGAAPGGWSKFLVDSGFKVIAIDSADLDYYKLNSEGVKIKKIKAGMIDGLEEDLKHYDIVHIKSNVREVDTGKINRVDLIASDMNTGPKESIERVLSFSGSLAKSAIAIITVKCTTRKVDGFLSEATLMLKDNFDIEGVRVLPSNRQEVTIYALYNKNT